MVQFKSLQPLSSEYLPTEQDLPDSDNRPVDNELQLLVPTLLRAILALAWADRTDWFLGVNLGLYYDPKQPAVGPDAFLSLGVPLYRPDKDLRLSYLLWEEGVVPQWALEVVSKKPGKEYDYKMQLYARLGVGYYVIYNPKYHQRDKHDVFEVYRLINGEYVRQSGNPVWMPEIGLGIGVSRGTHAALPPRDWLYWYDAAGNQYPAPENVIEQAQQAIRLAQQEAQAAQQEARRSRQEAQEAQQEARWSRQEARRSRQEAQEAQQEAQLKQRQMDEMLRKLCDRGIDPDTL
ncbi:MAG: Uma2 family endonuclease [Phormidesmis sp.]